MAEHKHNLLVTDVKLATVQIDATWTRRWYATRLPDHASVLIMAKYEDIKNKKRPKLYAYVGGIIWRSKEYPTYVAKIKDLDIQDVLKMLGIIEIDNGTQKKI